MSGRPLRIGVLGRTAMLLAAAERLSAAGHQIAFVATCRPSPHETTGVTDFEALARRHCAPFFLGPKLDRPETLQALETADCDLAISMNWLTLIPGTVRRLFRFGVLNAHPGDLPRYRGNACPNWAILQGEAEAVLTIHVMSDALDEGPVVGKHRFPLGGDTTIGEVYDWLQDAVATAFEEAVDGATEAGLSLLPPEDGPGLRCYPRRPEDGRIDWSLDSLSVHRLVRASGRPFGGAFTFLEGVERVVIWRSAMEPAAEPFLAVPGQIAFSAGGDPVVCCGRGYLRLAEIEMEGLAPEAAKARLLKSLRGRVR